ncbi:MAG: MBL fold metallo-hydrolase [Chitinophagaceae bacterium]|nr:MBL fold metallo-hydrolase [Chitinophagaceae bacterium]
MKPVIFLAALLLSATVFAQRPPLQTIRANSGAIQVQPITHATFVITYNNKTFYIDPTGGAAAFTGLAKPDVILVTDIHGDHNDPKTIDEIKTANTIVVAPKAVAEKLPGVEQSKLVVLNNGEKTDQAGATINAIPMYNLPEDAESRHTKGRGNGYVINFGGKNFYISGDTEDIPEMRQLKNIDVAFVCMNLPYTMDINQAASAVLEFKPKIVYPYHYRGQGGLSDVNGFKKLVNEKDKSIDVRLLNWYP